MKKTSKLFFAVCALGALAFLMGSCKKDDDSKGYTIGLPQFEDEVDGRAYVDFTVNKFKWNANDQVAIYNLDAVTPANSEMAIYQTTASAEGQTLASFTYASGDQLSAKKDGYFAFYPVSKLGNWDKESGNYQYFNVSATQTYTVIDDNVTVDPESMALACNLSKLGGTFTLKHIFGNLRLKLTGAGSVTSIVVEDARFNLSGTVGMKLHEVNMNTFTTLQNQFIASDDPYNAAFGTAWAEYANTLGYTTQGEGNTITLDCGEGVKLNETSETHFFIGLRPGALKYGFKVKVYVLGNAEPYVFDYTGNNNLHYGIKAGVNKGLSLAGID